MDTNRIKSYIEDGKYFSFTKEKIAGLQGLTFHEHVEPRIRKDDLTQALGMKVYDPLWMLSRQWQMGEFRGNNAGTAVSVRCQVRQEDCSSDPIEPVTEQVNPTIDLLARVESAMHYLDLAKSLRTTVDLPKLRKDYGIDWKGCDSHILTCEATEQAEDNLNAQRLSFAKTFSKNAFDGYALYLDLVKKKTNTPLARAYKTWFEKQYLPAGANGTTNSHWQEQELNYTVSVDAGSHRFRGDRYQGGRLSWYTVDAAGSTNRQGNVKVENIISLPTPAHYAGAPNKRLWQFEDRRVFMGNSTEQQSKANEIFLKFATLYSNDWMLIPLKTAIGNYITVTAIEVKDTFGMLHVIDASRRAGTQGNNAQGQWQMFTNSIHKEAEGVVGNGLFYAPQLAATMEGKPYEEVELLRDEMANMVWGVEKTVSDGCGFTLDQQLKAVQLKTYIDELYEQNRKKAEPTKVTFSEDGSTERQNVASSDYRYTLQTQVPFNWIPFVPQRIKDQTNLHEYFHLGGREMVLRRGKMPCHILTDEGYIRMPVLPVTSILRKGLDPDGDYQPLLINEEEVQQTGIKLTKNFQRARWLNGKTYLWAGIYKKLAKFSEKSGLEFDTLHKK